MAVTKPQIAAAIIAAGAAAAIILQFRSNGRLREGNRALSDQVAQLSQLRSESEQSVKAHTNLSQTMAEDQSRELLRLWGEVGVLRRRLAEATKAGETNTQVPQPLTQSETAEQERQMAVGRMNYPRNWMWAFTQYAQQNQGQCPTNFDQAAPFLPDEAKTETNLVPDQFEIVYQGSLNNLANRQNIIVIRQKEAWQSADGGWRRAYGFADGHSEIHSAADGNFGPWEAQHVQEPAGQ